MPLWLLMSASLWEKLSPERRTSRLILVPLLAYNLVCCFYAGSRFLDDPRIQSESWVAQNLPPGNSVEQDIYSPSWEHLPEVEAQFTLMPFVSGRERLFVERSGRVKFLCRKNPLRKTPWFL